VLYVDAERRRNEKAMSQWRKCINVISANLINGNVVSKVKKIIDMYLERKWSANEMKTSKNDISKNDMKWEIRRNEEKRDPKTKMEERGNMKSWREGNEIQRDNWIRK